MKRRSFATLTVALAVTAVPIMSLRGQDKAEAALKAAMDKETLDGNLKAAVDQYKKLAQDGSKSVAARALVRLGECYEKQGNAEARKTYEQVVNRFADQVDAVAQARARLAALGKGVPAAPLSTKLLWGSPKADGDSISPDGRYLSYTDWDTGNLMLHDLVTGVDRALTTAGRMKRGDEAYADTSAISKDGKRVAYAWYDDKAGRSGLWVTTLSGEPSPRRLIERPIATIGNWSQDGNWIGVSAEQREEGNSASAWQILLVNAQDGSLRLVKSFPTYRECPVDRRK